MYYAHLIHLKKIFRRMESITISSWIALMFGALHVLEPGHGKTALLTYMASGRKSWKAGVIISISSAITHSLAIFIIAFIAHYVVHHDQLKISLFVGHILSLVSSALICVLGIWIIFKGNQRKSCRSCNLHKVDEAKTATPDDYLTLGVLGVAVGIVPCPSVVVAYLSGVSTGNSLVGMENVILFAIGMCFSLTSVIVLCSLGGEKLLAKINIKKTSMNWSLIQGVTFLIIGIGTVFFLLN